MKKITSLPLLLILIITLVACSGNTTDFSSAIGIAQPAAASAGTTVTNQQTIAGTTVPTPEMDYDPEDLDTSPVDADGSTFIHLNRDSVTVDGTGASVEEAIVTISAAGTYQVNGTLNDGQIIVDTTDTENVTLILAGVDITSQTSAPIFVANAEKVILTLAEGSENTITDGDTYLALDESGEPNAAIFSKDDLTINGGGALTVNASYNNGIASKDDLKITGGTITVDAFNDGIKGKDSVAIKDGVLTINAGGDGIQASNAEDLEKGNIIIEGGVFNITAGFDGIQAENQLFTSAGEFNILSGGGSTNSTHTAAEANMGPGSIQQSTATEEDAAISMKGIKAGTNLNISGGIFEIDAADDALHSNDILTIDGGSFLLKSGDDGIHAENALTINEGDVNVQQAFEGFESAVITINDGDVKLVTSDDGLNATSGSGGEQVDDSYFYINGGYVLIDAFGDGLDSNGTAIMSGGVVIVQGAPSEGQGPLDVNGELEINGGVLIVAGSSFMPDIPSVNSTQNSIAIMLESVQAEGTIVHIESENGQKILTYESAKEFQLFVFSSPELQLNTTYAVYVGGEASGTITNGVYSDGSYFPGTLVANLEISNTLTTLGNFVSGGPGDGKLGEERSGRP